MPCSHVISTYPFKLTWLHMRLVYFNGYSPIPIPDSIIEAIVTRLGRISSTGATRTSTRRRRRLGGGGGDGLGLFLTNVSVSGGRPAPSLDLVPDGIMEMISVQQGQDDAEEDVAGRLALEDVAQLVGLVVDVLDAADAEAGQLEAEGGKVDVRVEEVGLVEAAGLEGEGLAVGGVAEEFAAFVWVVGEGEGLADLGAAKVEMCKSNKLVKL
jgi:hypothetical protein